MTKKENKRYVVRSVRRVLNSCYENITTSLSKLNKVGYGAGIRRSDITKDHVRTQDHE